jgi:type III secretion protein N (ATPase)
MKARDPAAAFIGSRLGDAHAVSSALARAAAEVPRLQVRGKVAEAAGILVKATGIDARIGDVCELVSPDGDSLNAEVVGLSRQGVLLVPFDGLDGVSAATQVVARGQRMQVAVGDGLLGRIVDGFGLPIDGRGDLPADTRRDLRAQPPHPLKRRRITQALSTGVRAIDGCLAVGEGQRVGIFAPAGVGKSTLLGMLARNSEAEVNVIALIGERGREVREFLEETLGEEAMQRSVCIVATSDKSAVERTRAAHVATAIAEHFRDQGRRVLLVMDSLTRFARAQRDIGLASGEPPTRRAFTPSVFAELPRLLERAGQGECGSITAFYTVLMEDEDSADPIAEEVRSILDGHIVLTRRLAAQGQYPAIDMLDSVSRVMPAIASAAQMAAAAHLRRLVAKYKDIELLLQIGEYQRGADALADESVGKRDDILRYLGQALDEPADGPGSVQWLLQLADGRRVETGIDP